MSCRTYFFGWIVAPGRKRVPCYFCCKWKRLFWDLVWRYGMDDLQSWSLVLFLNSKVSCLYLCYTHYDGDVHCHIYFGNLMHKSLLSTIKSCRVESGVRTNFYYIKTKFILFHLSSFDVSNNCSWVESCGVLLQRLLKYDFWLNWPPLWCFVKDGWPNIYSRYQLDHDW